MDIKTDVLERAVSGRYASSRKQGHRMAGAWFGLAAVMVMLLGAHKAFAGPPVLPGPSHSTNIALTYDNTRVVVANRDVNTVSVIEVRNSKGADVSNKLAEIPVGIEPHCVAITPDNSKAFVTNAVDGTVSAISLVNYTVLATIQVGTEPRGCALTPSGNVLYVANHTSGTVSIINTTSYMVIKTVCTGGNPTPLQSPTSATAMIPRKRSGSPTSLPIRSARVKGLIPAKKGRSLSFHSASPPFSRPFRYRRLPTWVSPPIEPTSAHRVHQCLPSFIVRSSVQAPRRLRPAPQLPWIRKAASPTSSIRA